MSSRKIFSKLEGEKRLELFGKESGDLEIHVDGAWGVAYTNGICKLQFYTVAPIIEEKYERREVAVRIAMVAPIFFGLRDYLIEQCKRLEEGGIVSPPEGLPEQRAEELPMSEVAEAPPVLEKPES